MLHIQTKPNTNGNKKQAIIDIENKTIKTGSYLFISYDVTGLTRTQFDDLVNYFYLIGFKEI